MKYIGLGSSVGKAESVFTLVEKELKKCQIKIVKKSNPYQSEPFGGVAKNTFTNAVWEINTDMMVQDFFAKIFTIEDICGRKPGENWDDRKIDIDILMWGSEFFWTPDLQIPHPHIPYRHFVLEPWQEIAPDNLWIPHLGRIKDLLSRII